MKVKIMSSFSFDPMMEDFSEGVATLYPDMGGGDDYVVGNSFSVDGSADSKDVDPVVADYTPLPLKDDFLAIIRRQPSMSCSSGDQSTPCSRSSSHTQLNCVSEHSSASQSSVNDCSSSMDDHMEQSIPVPRTSYCDDPESPSRDRNIFIRNSRKVSAVTPDHCVRNTVLYPSIDWINYQEAIDVEQRDTVGEDDYYGSHPLQYPSDEYALYRRKVDLQNSYQDTLRNLAECMKRTDRSRGAILQSRFLSNDRTRTSDLVFLTRTKSTQNLKRKESRLVLMSFILESLK
jgi:hypothetical protein